MASESLGGINYVGDIVIEADAPPVAKVNVIDTRFYDHPESSLEYFFNAYPELKEKKAFDTYFYHSGVEW